MQLAADMKSSLILIHGFIINHVDFSNRHNNNIHGPKGPCGLELKR